MISRELSTLLRSAAASGRPSTREENPALDLGLFPNCPRLVGRSVAAPPTTSTVEHRGAIARPCYLSRYPVTCCRAVGRASRRVEFQRGTPWIGTRMAEGGGVGLISARAVSSRQVRRSARVLAAATTSGGHRDADGRGATRTPRWSATGPCVSATRCASGRACSCGAGSCRLTSFSSRPLPNAERMQEV